MKREQILKLFKSLAQSQGYYGRLLAELNDADEEVRENFWQHMENQNFKDELDVILYLEV